MPLELLAPAGNWDCARAAVENGADAIYFGLESGFNARARATNFSLADLPPLMEFLHLRGVRGYVTLNTLTYSDELPALQTHAIAVSAANVDAVLVQDLGAARMIRAACPELEIHASTQMTLSSIRSIALAAQLGISRCVLPRELSIDEIAELGKQTDVGLEAFVHGALCVAYSGQCLTSESLGGRSANRGQCAQACRLPYEVICDGNDVDLADVKYLLSPQDLAAYSLLPKMIKAGVRSFKIEGRLKSPEYVASVTARYRQVLDAAIAGRDYQLPAKSIEELELSFSRGFSPGWLEGPDHKMLVPGTSSAKRGICVGHVEQIRNGRVTIHLQRQLKVEDGIVFAGDRESGDEQGGRVIAMRKQGQQIASSKRGSVEVTLRRERIDVDELYPGQLVWKTDDPELTKRLRATFSSPDPTRRVNLHLHIVAAVDAPLRIVARAENGATCDLTDVEPLLLARRHPLNVQQLREQFGRLGGSVYQLDQLKVTFVGQPMAPMSFLGRMRRRLVESLNQSLVVPPQTHHLDALSQLRTTIVQNAPNDQSPSPIAPQLHVLCRRLQQVSAVIEAGAPSVYVDFQDLRQYREAIAIANDNGVEITVATPRIEKPGESGIFELIDRQTASSPAASVLVRNLGGLAFFQERNRQCIADFSLNAANELTVQLLSAWGARRVTASYDLNRDQLLDMVEVADTSIIEIVIHQHMPMFHMEHCVFCAVLSPGTNKTNCGRPCDDHLVQLRDRVGMEHPLHADIGCRNTLYNATPQSSAEITPMLIDRKIRHFRIELLEDTPHQARKVFETYQQLLAGSVNGRDVWRRLKTANRVGVTRGTLEDRRNPLAII